MCCWNSFTVLQTFFSLQHFQGSPAPFRGIPGSDKMNNLKYVCGLLLSGNACGKTSERRRTGGGRVLQPPQQCA